MSCQHGTLSPTAANVVWRVLEQVVAIGAVLMQARERRGLTTDEVASASRIPVHYIEALETEAFDDIPAPVYVRGFLRVYSRLLEIDSEPLLEELVSVWPPAVTSAAPLPSPALSAHPAPEAWELPDTAGTASPLPHRRIISDAEEDWEQELEPVVRTRGARALAHLKKRNHLEGVLTEREAVDPVRLPDRRLIMLGGAGVVLLAVVLLGAAVLRGSGTTDNQAGPSPVADRTFQPGTVIAVGSPTATPSPPATPASGASAPPGASPAVEASGTPAGAPPAAPTP